jgi:hypothetical protein
MPRTAASAAMVANLRRLEREQEARKAFGNLPYRLKCLSLLDGASAVGFP